MRWTESLGCSHPPAQEAHEAGNLLGIPGVMQEQPAPLRLHSGLKGSAVRLELMPLDAALKSSSLEQGAGGSGRARQNWQQAQQGALGAGNDGRQGGERGSGSLNAGLVLDVSTAREQLGVHGVDIESGGGSGSGGGSAATARARPASARARQASARGRRGRAGTRRRWGSRWWRGGGAAA